MIIRDISRGMFQAEVYPGDPEPEYSRVKEIERGDVCNLSVLKAGAHNATHVDAPFHFFSKGKTIEDLELQKCIGDCFVIQRSGKIEGEDIAFVLRKTAIRKLLIKGDIEITEEAACIMAEASLELLGVEGLTVGTEITSKAVHRILLEKEIVIVESLDLSGITEGEYFLVSAPVKYENLDGAPCRAVLLSWEA